jgi:hypothetical protein
MKVDKDPFPVNMNIVKLDGKKVLVWLSQAELTKGKDVVIGEERLPRMIKPKSPKGGQWQKNEGGGGKLRQCPKATFDILMAKYKEGKANIRGCENQTIWNTTVQFPCVRPAHLQSGAHPANDLRLCHGNVQKVGNIVSKITIRCLTSRSGHQCLGRGDLHR